MTKGEFEGFKLYMGLVIVFAYIFVCYGLAIQHAPKEAFAAGVEHGPPTPFMRHLDLCRIYEGSCNTVPEAEETVEQMIVRMANEYGVDPNRALAIAWCESRFDPNARNWEGSTAKGVYQFTDPTWKWIGAEGHQFDVEENIKQFMIWYPKKPSWWACDELV